MPRCACRRRPRLAVRGQEPGVPGALCHGQAALSRIALHIDRARSARLEPPWPDLILTVGRRPSMAALWVKAQAQGRARLVVVGRPKRWLDRFDLVIAPPQFQLPSRPNVLRLDLPLMPRGRGCSRDRRRRLARAIRRLVSAAGRAARGRPDQAVCVRSDGRQAPDRPGAERRRRAGDPVRHDQPPHAAAVIEAIAAALPTGRSPVPVGCRRR